MRHKLLHGKIVQVGPSPIQTSHHRRCRCRCHHRRRPNNHYQNLYMVGPQSNPDKTYQHCRLCSYISIGPIPCQTYLYVKYCSCFYIPDRPSKRKNSVLYLLLNPRLLQNSSWEHWAADTLIRPGSFCRPCNSKTFSPHHQPLCNTLSYSSSLSSLSSPRAEMARAVTGRQCPHCGVGEDFLVRC